MAGNRAQHHVVKLSLAPRFFRFFYVALLLFGSAIGGAVPSPAAPAVASTAMTAGMSMAKPCPAKAATPLRETGATLPLAADPCCHGPSVCSSCASPVVSLLPLGATPLPAAPPARAVFLSGFYNIPLGQVARPHSPPPRRLV
ncbi:hypothetical protein [Acidiphilium sp. 20-67-58]|uniref:hypothetical protein n=1 Tax=Acidiphilium sp. 20-67-58 TaxID=1970291 RepID=UPI0025C6FDAF|nr:hypothetical protein [Acidiphilium sp. 20-67-58]